MINLHLILYHQVSRLMVTSAKRHLWCNDKLVRIFLFDLMKICADQTFIIYNDGFITFFPLFIPVLFLNPSW